VSTAALRSNASAVRMLLRSLPPLPEAPRCTECGKRRYATRQAAERHLRALLAGPWIGVVGANAYHEHGWWHLTSGDRNKDAAMEAAGNEEK
jgi:hypothetical protein